MAYARLVQMAPGGKEQVDKALAQTSASSKAQGVTMSQAQQILQAAHSWDKAVAEGTHG